VFFEAFLDLQFDFVIFWLKNIGTKAACKILMKFTPWIDFTNILPKAFTNADPKCVIKTDSLTVIFALFVSVSSKSACKMLMKLTPDLMEQWKCYSKLVNFGETGSFKSL